MNYKDLAANIEAYIIEQRRWFHQHPELSWEEVETTKEIVRQLEAMGYVFEAQEAVDENNTLVRFVTSWATPVEAVDQFLKDLAACK